jgi:hypothetical protein
MTVVFVSHTPLEPYPSSIRTDGLYQITLTNPHRGHQEGGTPPIANTQPPPHPAAVQISLPDLEDRVSF